jgi:DNA mismatch repair protein MutS2
MYFASLGMYVPAWEAVLPEIGNLLFLMGDYQSLSDSLSSFAAHLKRWKGVLGKASSKTFLLVDEIMDATDPREGECLAVEMLKHLGALGLQGIVSTHYSEVKKLPLDDMAFVNGSMVFDTKNLEPTYMLAMGTPGNSYGIELAQKFKLPKGIVAGARKAMGKRHFELNRLIAQQKEEQVKIRKLKEKHQVMLAKFKELRTVGRQLLTDFEKKRESILAKAYRNSLKEVRQFKKKWDRILQQNVNLEAPEEDLPTKKQEFLEAVERQQKSLAKKMAKVLPTYALQTGDTVRVLGYNKSATIQELNIDKEQAKVRMGTLVLTVPLEELEKVSSGQQVKINKGPSYRFTPADPYEDRELDLRGKRGDEVLLLLERYLDQAALKNYTILKIVCGRGVVREIVKEFLDKNIITAGKDRDWPTEGTVTIKL